jgi:hypothetical protein
MQDPAPDKPERRERRKMDLQFLGQLMLVGGIVVAVTGGVLMLLARVPAFSKLGRLPGDIRIEGEGFACFVPIATMILLSIVLTIVLNIVIRLINRP